LVRYAAPDGGPGIGEFYRDANNFSPRAGLAYAFEQVSPRPSIYRADAGMATPYSQQASFSAEHLLAHDLTATATFLLVGGVKLPRTRNINLLPPAAGVFGPGRADPRVDNIYQLEHSASSTHCGLRRAAAEPLRSGGRAGAVAAAPAAAPGVQRAFRTADR
jgi:hypothetical protein